MVISALPSGFPPNLRSHLCANYKAFLQKPQINLTFCTKPLFIPNICSNFAAEMVCGDFYRALEERVRRYEQVCVIADEAVRVDLPYPTLRIRIDEAAKSLETVQQIWDFLFAHDLTRRGLLIAVGGGVLTDLAGFAAATYKRGIDYINVPTTLLAMVDASSGGKTGFNYRGLKNSIGAFHAPIETIIDTKWQAPMLFFRPL